jgi:hypothetical protein
MDADDWHKSVENKL